jgi:2-oxoglutarate ferredoxin oxidoreductase subunit delta
MALEALAAVYQATVAINHYLCKGCGICAALCPKVLTMNGSGKVSVSNQSLCTGCRNCESHCPDFAISMRMD